jgi:succinate dehydrogenase/fumarate reductase iron-sulfur protein
LPGGGLTTCYNLAVQGFRALKLQVWRQEPGAAGQLRAYEVQVPGEGMIIDALFAVQAGFDSSLAFRVSCRAGICGSCAVRVDGRERLACQTPLSLVGDTARVEPLRNLPVLRDLVVDLDPFFEKWGRVGPDFRARSDLAEPARIPHSQRRLVDRTINCITCGACYSACDVVAINPRFLGPAALARAYALVGDARDGDSRSRMPVAAGRDGVWRCHTEGACTVVCPKAVAPTLAIQALRRKSLWKS